MKPQFALAALVLLSTLNPQLSTCFAQGSLTPPGAPAPTMKSLAQMEPRTAITNTGAVTLSSPGSYYLTGNITVSSGDAVTITTNGVTLDLNGFSVSSTAASPSGAGIKLSGSGANIAIRNGFITGGITNNGATYGGTGFACGITNAGALPQNVRVTDVGVSGCLSDGINLGFKSTVVRNCTVSTVGGAGIVAQAVSDSTAMNCRSNAVWAVTANNCSGESVGSGDGINASVVQNCYGTSLSGAGLNATYSALNCYGYSSGGTYGLAGGGSATTLNCVGKLNSGNGDGLSAETVGNCIGQATGTGRALKGFNVQNSEGHNGGTGTGLLATTAQNCRGVTHGSDGAAVNAVVAFGCGAYNFAGVGIDATIANSCRVDGGTTNITYKYNMP